MGFDVSVIEDIRFSSSFKGYDTDEVDEFLDEIVVEIEKLNTSVASLSIELKKKNDEIDTVKLALKKAKEQQAASSSTIVHAAPIVEKPAFLRKEPVVIEPIVEKIEVQETDVYKARKDMEKILADTLVNAQISADQVVTDAKIKANTILADSKKEAAVAISSIQENIRTAETKLTDIYEMAHQAKTRYHADLTLQMQTLENMQVVRMSKTNQTTTQNNVVTDNNIEAPAAKSPTGEVESNQEYIEQALSMYNTNPEDVEQPKANHIERVDKDSIYRIEDKPLLTSVIDDILNMDDDK